MDTSREDAVVPGRGPDLTPEAVTFSTSSGTAHVFYPKATNEECTVALLANATSLGGAL